jgi:uncharacterized protein (DUF924 family)
MASADPPIAPADVLGYWFRDPPFDAAAAMPWMRRWFQGGPEVDREIVDHFAAAVGAAIGGGFGSWEAEPRDRLALIIVLDQFTRNVFRDDPRTFAGDARAQRLALDALDRGLDRPLPPPERDPRTDRDSGGGSVPRRLDREAASARNGARALVRIYFGLRFTAQRRP